jgi:hypothetical protein
MLSRLTICSTVVTIVVDNYFLQGQPHGAPPLFCNNHEPIGMTELPSPVRYRYAMIFKK